jgi:hypothetical protein
MQIFLIVLDAIARTRRQQAFGLLLRPDDRIAFSRKRISQIGTGVIPTSTKLYTDFGHLYDSIQRITMNFIADAFFLCRFPAAPLGRLKQ